MWDKPDVLNAIANLLLAAAFLSAAYGVALAVARLPAFPLREVRVNGELAHVTREQVEIVVRGGIRGNFFTLELARARAVFEKLPWVRKASLRRHWPDRIEVTLEEHVALARWGDTALVNVQGEVFTAAYDAPASREQGSRLRDATGRESGAALSSAGVASVSGVTSPKGAPVPPTDGAPASREQGPAERGAGTRLRDATAEQPEIASLPLFIGPPGSAKEIAIQYGYFQRSLAAIGRAPVQVQVSPRRAWQVRLEDGLTLELGRERIESRIDRFIAVYDRTIKPLHRRIDYVDLRYPNGFAVRIPELKPAPQQRRGRSSGRASG